MRIIGWTKGTRQNCAGTHSDALLDTGGNYSDDGTCSFTDVSSMNNVFIIVGLLADNGGPTQTMALLGEEPLDGATVDCDALDSAGDPTGMSIGIDQRSFPRPFGPDCDSGAYEAVSSVPGGPEAPPGPSGSSCAVAGSGNGNDGLGGLLLYALIPLGIIIRRRFIDRRSQHRHM